MKQFCKAALFTTMLTTSSVAQAADYQAPDATTPLAEGVYLENLGEVYSTDYTVQRLSERAYWVGIHGYNALVLVGDEGVLVVDPLRAHSKSSH